VFAAASILGISVTQSWPAFPYPVVGYRLSSSTIQRVNAVVLTVTQEYQESIPVKVGLESTPDVVLTQGGDLEFAKEHSPHTSLTEN